MTVYSLVRVTVEDYDRWRTAFDGAAGLREEYGCLGGQIFVKAGSSTELVVLLEWADSEQAAAFSSSPDLRAAMQDGGVMGPPDSAVLELVENIAV